MQEKKHTFKSSLYRGIYKQIAEEESRLNECAVTPASVRMSVRRGNVRLQARFVEIVKLRQQARREFECIVRGEAV
jgi:hypothetical protein